MSNTFRNVMQTALDMIAAISPLKRRNGHFLNL